MYKAYSRSNRNIDVDKKDIGLMLYGINKQLIPLKKFGSPEAAKTDLEEYNKQLGLKNI
ncbi:MAG: hypothetical protein J7L04_11760 [Bacteroidales bacterium]|nr:hypothetical protein [Bacteroidales bacterium]